MENVEVRECVHLQLQHQSNQGSDLTQQKHLGEHNRKVKQGITT